MASWAQELRLGPSARRQRRARRSLQGVQGVHKGAGDLKRQAHSLGDLQQEPEHNVASAKNGHQHKYEDLSVLLNVMEEVIKTKQQVSGNPELSPAPRFEVLENTVEEDLKRKVNLTASETSESKKVRHKSQHNTETEDQNKVGPQL